MKIQMRLYTVNRGMLDQFISEWQEKIYPLRQKLGFTIPVAYAIRETNQFVWFLGYDGPGTWEERDEQYYASPERKGMDPNPARHIARMELHFVDPALPKS
jgi:hypothetical protein